MHTTDLLFWIKATPFQPFRVTLNSGRIYTVRHSETVRLLRGSFVLFTPLADMPDVFDAEMIGLNLIERIEPAPVAAH
jgi:hypothetical protein